MRKIILFIFTLSLYSNSVAQDIKISSSYSISSYLKYKNNFGYGIGFIKSLKTNNRLGLAFSHSFNNSRYQHEFFSDAYGIEYYREVTPSNQLITFSIDYCINTLYNQKSRFLIGPRITLNYFFVNEIIDERLVNKTEEYRYNLVYWQNNKIGIGLIFEYQRRIAENMFVCISVEPEAVFLTRFDLVGSSEPPVVGFINFNLGINYKLNRE